MSDRLRSRREFLKELSAAAGVVFLPSVFSACAGGGAPSSPTGGAASPPAGASPTAAPNAKWPAITSKEVVVAGFGGKTYEVRHEINFTPFTRLAGARVIDAPWDYGKFVAMVDAARAEWDMIDFDGYSTVGLIQSKKPPAKLADWVRRCDMVDKPYQDYCAGNYAYSVVMGWSTSVGGTPATWADFFDTAKFPGKRSFPKSIYAGTVEIALLADGVPKDRMYPLDFDRAFKKLDTIKRELLFYGSYAEGQQHITQGSASMIATANSRTIQLKQEGNFDFTYQDAVLYPWGAFAMPQHAPHPDAANALIDFLSTPQQQAEVARRLFLGPVVSDAFDLLTPDELAQQPNSPENKAKALTVNTEVAAKQDAEYVDRFFKWVGQ
jgi:putative spermidine/putrescine transport system substrate-binding protein